MDLGKLDIITQIGDSKRYQFRCVCGATFIALLSRVTSGKVRHCGCLAKTNREVANQKNGVSRQTNDEEIAALVHSRGLVWVDEPNDTGIRYSHKNHITVRCKAGHETKTTRVYLRKGKLSCRICNR
jgi:hypothetical protein